MSYRAVLFDWMLTLADYPRPAEMLRRAAAVIGRPMSADEIADHVERLGEADALPEVERAMATVDCSAAEHRTVEMLRFEKAGFDAELAAALYALLGDPSVHPVYAEVPGVLERLTTSGTSVIVISDIHVDLRHHARLAGINQWIDGWVLSFEHRVQKPDARIFELALEAADVDARDALMVGDRHSADGAASLLGIDSLILPARPRDPSVACDRLDGVVRLAVRHVETQSSNTAATRLG